MKQYIILITLVCLCSITQAQTTDSIQDLKYNYKYQFTGEINNETDSIYQYEMEVEFPEDVEITDVSFDSDTYKKELSKKKGSGQRVGKSHGKKMAFDKKSSHYHRFKQAKVMYLKDSNGKFYRVKLDKEDPVKSDNSEDPDPKMIRRRPIPKTDKK